MLRKMLLSISSAFVLLSGTPTIAQIQLGDTIVPKEKFFVFIFLGHSNMTGRHRNPDKVEHPRVWKLPLNFDPLLEWSPGIEPMCLDNHQQTSGRYGGPAIPLMKLLAEKYPDYWFGGIQYSGSGSDDFALEPKFIPGKDGYEIVKEAALTYKDKVTFAGVVTMLGQIEIFGEWAETRPRFAENIKSMMDGFKEELDAPDLPLLFTQFPQEAGGKYSPDTEAGQEIMAQTDLIPDLVSPFALIPSHDIDMHDGHHYSELGYQVWAQRAADLIRDNQFGPAGEVGSRHLVDAIRSTRPTIAHSRLPMFGSSRRISPDARLFDCFGRAFAPITQGHDIPSGVYLKVPARKLNDR